MSEQTPEEIEAEASADVQRADEALAALEQRVLDDDQDVTPQEIETARSARHFAGLRQRAAQKKAEKLRQDALDAEREQAFADAREILAEVDDDEVTAAVEAAGEAMAKVRAAVRARNDAHDRARARLEASVVEAVAPEPVTYRGQPSPTYPDLGYGWSSGRPILWLDGGVAPRLDEGAEMDRARKMPADRDAAEEQVRQQAAAARLIEQDSALYREDRPAFEALPATRRKPAIDALGIDWQQYIDRRERDLMSDARTA
ncbi:hypothetical protein ACIRO1_17260 [Streptomyces sp. NPDC102381]|uniref:hypothetical protein n=1 Tax=Streptomyces sp. NPDC102381 TaxID=3366164 RepID=UPI00382B34F6